MSQEGIGCQRVFCRRTNQVDLSAYMLPLFYTCEFRFLPTRSFIFVALYRQKVFKNLGGKLGLLCKAGSRLTAIEVCISWNNP